MSTFLTCGATFVICILLCACTTSKTFLEHVDAKTFLERAKTADGTYSAESAVFIGTTEDRVYLEYTTAITFFRKGPDTIVCWIKFDELPKDISDQIKASNPPWIPFSRKN